MSIDISQRLGLLGEAILNGELELSAYEEAQGFYQSVDLNSDGQIDARDIALDSFEKAESKLFDRIGFFPEQIAEANGKEEALKVLSFLREHVRAQQVLRMELFMSERSPTGDPSKRRAFLEAAQESLFNGKASNLAEALEQAKTKDGEGYRLWRDFSQGVLRESIIQSNDPGSPQFYSEPDDYRLKNYRTRSFPKIPNSLEEATKTFSPKVQEELWMQRANLLFHWGDFEGIRFVLDQLLAEGSDDRVKRNAAFLLDRTFDPQGKWHQITEENRRNFLGQLLLTVPVTIAGGMAANLARGAIVGTLERGVATYVGESALRMTAVRAPIYTAGLLGAGYAFEGTTATLMTPLMGKQVWNHFLSNGIKASVMFGVLDAGKFAFQFAAGKRLSGALRWTGELTTEGALLTGYQKALAMFEGKIPTDESFLENFAANILLILELRAGGHLVKEGVRGFANPVLKEPDGKEIAQPYNMRPSTFSGAQKQKLQEIGAEFSRSREALESQFQRVSSSDAALWISNVFEKTAISLAKIFIPKADYNKMAMIMFGSASRREVNIDSDCDILIVVKDAADLPRFRQYMADMMEGAKQIGFTLEKFLSVVALDGDGLAPARWESREILPENIVEALVSSGQLTSLRFLEGDPALYERFHSEIADTVIQKPGFIVKHHENLVEKNPALNQFKKQYRDNHLKIILVKKGLQRLLNSIAWIAASRYRTRVEDTQKGFDVLLNRGAVDAAEHQLLTRLLRATLFLRRFGHAEGPSNSETVSTKAMEDLVQQFNSGSMPPQMRAEFAEAFHLGNRQKCALQNLLDQLFNDVVAAETIAKKIIPRSIKIKEGLIRRSPNWAHQQVLRLRLWQLQKQYDLLKTKSQEGEKKLGALKELIDYYVSALESVTKGDSLKPESFRSLLLQAPRMIDRLSEHDLPPTNSDRISELQMMISLDKQ